MLIFVIVGLSLIPMFTPLSPSLCRYSVNVFQPPFQSGRTSPEGTQCRADLPPPAETPEGVGPGDEARGGGAGDSDQESPFLVPESPLETAQASAHPAGDPDALSTRTTDSGFSEPSSCSQDPQGEKETSCEKAVRPEGKGEHSLSLSYRFNIVFYFHFFHEIFHLTIDVFHWFNPVTL